MRQTLPAWLPPNVQDYIRNVPSFSEGSPQGVWTGDPSEPPQSPNPQIDDIHRLFSGQSQRNSTTAQQLNARKYLPQLMKLPGFTGFVGGDDI
jgi:hypothetical protein